MPQVSLAFFVVSPICALIGMLWGMYMGMTGDHLMHPAHAHLNLLGFVQLAIMGTFYALAGDKAPGKLAWINFGLSTFGVIGIIPLLALVIGGNEALGPAMMPGELATVLGMAVFLAAVVKTARNSKNA